MTSIPNRILNYLSIEARPQTSLEIAQNLKLNENTVRARVSELCEKGMVLKKFEHHYLIAVGYGVMGLPRVQNLQVRVGVGVRVVHRGLPGSGFRVSVVGVDDLSVVLRARARIGELIGKHVSILRSETRFYLISSKRHGNVKNERALMRERARAKWVRE